VSAAPVFEIVDKAIHGSRPQRQGGTVVKEATKPKAKKRPAAAAKSATKKHRPTEAEAAVAIARAWLAKAGFHEDPDSESAERIEFGFSDVGSDGERYVNVRVYIPALDIDHVVDGTHLDGITVEGT
jgi:hypothetical protein